MFVERLWKSVKYERVYWYAYDSVTEARQSIMPYRDWYNRARPHSSLGKQTSAETPRKKLRRLCKRMGPLLACR